MQIEIGVFCAAIGCLVGLGGWLAGREKSIRETAKWQGSIDEKLKGILDRLDKIERKN